MRIRCLSTANLNSEKYELLIYWRYRWSSFQNHLSFKQTFWNFCNTHVISYKQKKNIKCIVISLDFYYIICTFFQLIIYSWKKNQQKVKSLSSLIKKIKKNILSVIFRSISIRRISGYIFSATVRWLFFDASAI